MWGGAGERERENNKAISTLRMRSKGALWEHRRRGVYGLELFYDKNLSQI